MSKWIEVEPLMDKAKEYGGYYEDTVYAVPLADISEAPSIDIVRCGECKHLDIEYVENEHGKDDEYPMCLRFEDYTFDVKADDFCSYGERNDNE